MSTLHLWQLEFSVVSFPLKTTLKTESLLCFSSKRTRPIRAHADLQHAVHYVCLSVCLFACLALADEGNARQSVSSAEVTEIPLGNVPINTEIHFF